MLLLTLSSIVWIAFHATEIRSLNQALVTFSGRIDDQNVVVGRINKVVVLMGYFF